MSKAAAFTCLLMTSLLSQSPGAQEPAPSTLKAAVIKMSRTACFGTCPVYDLELDGSGSVTYVGKKFVRVVGKRTAHIDPAKVAELIRQFHAINFFGLQDSYMTMRNPNGTETVVTDLPSTFLSLTIGGKQKQIEDYYGTPEELIDLEDQIDKLANTQQWLFIDTATIRKWAGSGWNAQENGDKYLDKAIYWRDRDLATLLLDLGTDPSAQGTRTIPLVAAAQTGDREILSLLLKRGADPNRRDRHGRSALGAAVSEESAHFVGGPTIPEVIRILKAAEDRTHQK